MTSVEALSAAIALLKYSDNCACDHCNQRRVVVKALTELKNGIEEGRRLTEAVLNKRYQ